MAARKKPTSVSDAISAVNDAMRAKLRDGEMDELVKLAIDIIHQDYWDDVRGITAELIRQVEDGEVKDQDGLNEALHQAVDGSARIIYTFQARLGLLATNNPDAYEEDMGEKPEGPEQQLFIAMEHDVRAQLEAEDVDSMFGDDD